MPLLLGVSLHLAACDPPQPKVHIQEPFEAAAPPKAEVPPTPTPPPGPPTTASIAAALPSAVRMIESEGKAMSLRVAAVQAALVALPPGADPSVLRGELHRLAAEAAALHERAQAFDREVRILSAMSGAPR
jgi:hypothetical protein